MIKTTGVRKTAEIKKIYHFLNKYAHAQGLIDSLI